MKIIKNPYAKYNNSAQSTVDAIIGKQVVLRKNTKFRVASYIMPVKITDAEEVVLTNTLNGLFVSVHKNEYDAMLNGTLEQLNPFLYDYLVMNWVLVPEYFNEVTLVDMLRNNKYSLYNRKTNLNMISHFTILPTTDCNARCYYCYESIDGVKRKTMTKETSEKVADFMTSRILNLGCKNSNPDADTAQITWFGGEPTLNFEAIRIITNKLLDNDIKFTASLLTNGYLLTEDTIKYLKRANVTFVQVTIDGVGDVYKSIKNYTNDDPDPFSTVINNIKTLLSYGIHTDIRLNLSLHNYEEIKAVLTFYYKEFLPGLTEEEKKNTDIYFHSMFSNYCGETEIDKLNEVYGLESNLLDYVLELDPDLANYIPVNYQLNKLGGLNVIPCMTNIPNSIAIGPDGDFMKCENCLEGSVFWNINSYYLDMDTSVLSRWEGIRKTNERCFSCVYYPSCVYGHDCHASEACSPGFIEYMDHQNSIITNKLYHDTVKHNKQHKELFMYDWNLESVNNNFGLVDFDTMHVLCVDDTYLYALNTISVRGIDYIITIPTDAISADVRIYRYMMEEDSLIIDDMQSLEESIVVYTLANKLVDNRIIIKLIEDNSKKEDK